MASSSSNAVLADLGRSSYVSQRGLADTLRRLQSTGKLSKEEAVSRSSIKRAREFEMESHTTRYGKICFDKELTAVSESTLKVTLVNPVSLLVYLLENNMALQHFSRTTQASSLHSKHQVESHRILRRGRIGERSPPPEQP